MSEREDPGESVPAMDRGHVRLGVGQRGQAIWNVTIPFGADPEESRAALELAEELDDRLRARAECKT